MITIERLQQINTAAEAAARALVPGHIFVGGFGEAANAGITCERERSLFCTLYLGALPAHRAIVTKWDTNEFIAFE